MTLHCPVAQSGSIHCWYPTELYHATYLWYHSVQSTEVASSHKYHTTSSTTQGCHAQVDGTGWVWLTTAYFILLHFAQNPTSHCGWSIHLSGGTGGPTVWLPIGDVPQCQRLLLDRVQAKATIVHVTRNNGVSLTTNCVSVVTVTHSVNSRPRRHTASTFSRSGCRQLANSDNIIAP